MSRKSRLEKQKRWREEAKSRLTDAFLFGCEQVYITVVSYSDCDVIRLYVLKNGVRIRIADLKYFVARDMGITEAGIPASSISFADAFWIIENKKVIKKRGSQFGDFSL